MVIREAYWINEGGRTIVLKSLTGMPLQNSPLDLPRMVIDAIIQLDAAVWEPVRCPKAPRKNLNSRSVSYDREIRKNGRNMTVVAGLLVGGRGGSVSSVALNPRDLARGTAFIISLGKNEKRPLSFPDGTCLLRILPRASRRLFVLEAVRVHIPADQYTHNAQRMPRSTLLKKFLLSVRAARMDRARHWHLGFAIYCLAVRNISA